MTIEELENKLYEEYSLRLDQIRDYLVDKVDLYVDTSLMSFCDQVLEGQIPISREEIKEQVKELIRQELIKIKEEDKHRKLA